MDWKNYLSKCIHHLDNRYQGIEHLTFAVFLLLFFSIKILCKYFLLLDYNLQSNVPFREDRFQKTYRELILFPSSLHNTQNVYFCPSLRKNSIVVLEPKNYLQPDQTISLQIDSSFSVVCLEDRQHLFRCYFACV